MKKVGRREFLGLIGGAAAAGPSLANDVVQYMPSSLPSAVSYSGGIMDDTLQTASAGFFDKASRISQLKRLISGEYSDEEKKKRKIERLYCVDAMFSQNVACLRSVSAYNKLRIHSERMQIVKDEINRIQNETYLERLLRGES